MEALTGSTPDVSVLLRFTFWEPVYFRMDDSDFPSESRELRGHFVGVSESVGHALTYKVLTDDTLRVLSRSALRSASHSQDRNLRLDPPDGERDPSSKIPEIVKTKTPQMDRSDTSDEDSTAKPSQDETSEEQEQDEDPIIDLIGRSSLLEQVDGTKLRVRI